MALFAPFFLSVFVACEKPKDEEDPMDTIPTVSTRNTELTDSTSGVGGGNVLTDGGHPVTERGICWSTDTPTVANLKSIDGSGLGAFESEIGLLKTDQVYFVRAYATNLKGTGYGELDSIYTNTGVLPFIRTAAATEVLTNSAILNGWIGFEGTESPDSYGLCYSTSPLPDTNDIVLNANLNNGKFSATANNLADFTVYYVRAFCKNNNDINYGNQEIFITESKFCEAPTNIFDFSGNEILVDSIVPSQNFTISMDSKSSRMDTNYTGWTIAGEIRFPRNAASGDYVVFPYEQIGNLDSNMCMTRLQLTSPDGFTYDYEVQEGAEVNLDRITTNSSVTNFCEVVVFGVDTNHTFTTSFRLKTPTLPEN